MGTSSSRSSLIETRQRVRFLASAPLSVRNFGLDGFLEVIDRLGWVNVNGERG